jgi:predicted transcriptional regulator
VDILNDLDAPAKLRAEAVSILGLLGPERNVYEYAESLSGLTTNQAGVLNLDQLTIALRALGSLLASGDWDVPTLQNMQRMSQEGGPQSELYNVLLGWRYEPEIARLRNDLQNERDARKREIMALTARIAHDQAQMRELERQLEDIHHEHGIRGDELYQVTQEREAIRDNLDQIVKERESFRTSLDQVLREKQALQAEIAELQARNTVLEQQIKLLRDME